MITDNQFEVTAMPREKCGKNASRRLRHEDKLPAVVYGGGKDTIALMLDHKKLAKALKNESFYSRILTLKVDNTPEFVILKDVSRHPYKPRIQHIDFQRVREDEKLHMNIPIHFIGGDKAPGVSEGGGIVSHIMSDIEISCLPANLPSFVELDISEMTLNQIKHISDIKLPAGVESVDLLHDNDKPVVSIHMPRIEEEPAVDETAIPISAEVPAIAQKSAAELAAEAASKANEKASKKK
ncbi:MAG: 50S ribosomal protein L25/general stress protein Ctc [Gammaproteobacteria bacterium RIFCSPHIGHO2_12_FULL_42_10]|nr:MAG: 50S ribosomal protein L25/general stress protein Ctc [Gammaproteobacteria bacterium RIFCSPHIGHO2_12_FULL_42_10]